jgi:hypothetical protein
VPRLQQQAASKAIAAGFDLKATVIREWTMADTQLVSDNAEVTKLHAEAPAEPIFQFGLKRLFLIFFLVALFLSLGISFNRWLNSRPGKELTESSGLPIEINEIRHRVGLDSLQELHVWRLYVTGWFSFDFVWKAKTSPEAVSCLQELALMNAISVSQVPIQFWSMPPERSDMPKWWDPKQVRGAQYYMSPTFVPFSVANEKVDCVAMYDPNRQLLYVWSQFDF